MCTIRVLVELHYVSVAQCSLSALCYGGSDQNGSSSEGSSSACKSQEVNVYTTFLGILK